jgi:hypothetical protein
VYFVPVGDMVHRHRDKKVACIFVRFQTPLQMERISNCPNRQEIKELIVGFKDIKLRCLRWVGSPLFNSGRIILRGR